MEQLNGGLAPFRPATKPATGRNSPLKQDTDMVWQFWVVVWGWFASAVMLVGAGGFVGSDTLISLGLVDALAFICAAIWFAGKLNTDI